MAGIMKWLSGKKTYATVIIIFILGGLQASGVQIPEFVFAALTALGITFARIGAVKE